MAIVVRTWTPGDVKTRQASWYQANKATHKNNVKLSKRAEKNFNPRAFYARSMWDAAKIRARKQGIPFELVAFSKQHVRELLQLDTPCACCGAHFEYTIGQPGAKNDRSPSIDKVNPDLGYVDGNVAIICWRCNYRKRDMSAHDLRQMLEYAESYL